MFRFVGAKGTLYVEWCIFKGQKGDHAEVVVGNGLNGCSFGCHNCCKLLYKHWFSFLAVETWVIFIHPFNYSRNLQWSSEFTSLFNVEIETESITKAENSLDPLNSDAWICGVEFCTLTLVITDNKLDLLKSSMEEWISLLSPLKVYDFMLMPSQPKLWSSALQLNVFRDSSQF